MWKNFIREYLTFSKRERKGLFILLGIILLCKTAPLFFPLISDKKVPDNPGFRKAVASFMAQQHKPETAGANAGQPVTLFPFDPNTISKATWQQLGVPAGIASVIQHYRKAGGHFYKKEDLKKIYGLSDSAYQRLAPYIRIKEEKKQRIPQRQSVKKRPVPVPVNIAGHHKQRFKKPVIININQADSTAWSRLYGIGPVLSARIIRFRKALGGFYKVAQVAEVYGLPDSTFQRIKKQLNISTVSLKKLNINTASVEKLKSHPYIKSRIANAIKDFRDMHGKFDSLPQLKELQLVNDQIYRKIVPYLTIK